MTYVSPQYAATPWDDYINLFGNAAVIYDSDALSNPVQTKVAFSNARSLPMLGSGRSDVTETQFLSDAPIVPGKIINLPTAPNAWYVVIKRLNKSDPGIVVSAILASLFPLPVMVTITDAGDVPFSTLSPYGEPTQTDGNGNLVIPTQTTYTVHAALSNDFDPLGNHPEGDLPDAIETIVIPLGSPIKKAESVELPDGRIAVVNQTNTLYSEGHGYARQLVLAGAMASGTVA